jgi:hypothetical protein
MNETSLEGFRLAIEEQTAIMRENAYAPETYFILSIINFAEMITGLMMGLYATSVSQSWVIGFIGHMCAMVSVSIGSIWIWFNYPTGVRGEEGKFTSLGA